MSARLLVIDCETGGLDPYEHSLLSLGAVVWEDGSILGEIELLVVEQPIRADATALSINNINIDDHRSHGISPKIATDQLSSFLSQHFGSEERIALVGHNVAFDVGFLKRLYRLAGEDYQSRFSHRALDTASIMRFLSLAGRLPFNDPTLDAGLRFFHIEVPTHSRHTALADARATGNLLSQLIRLAQQ